jgi:hypothetical protein
VLGVVAELVGVALPKLREAFGAVGGPAAQLVARREVARPLIDAGLGLGDAERPEPVDQRLVADSSEGRPARRGRAVPPCRVAPRASRHRAQSPATQASQRTLAQTLCRRLEMR